jgi:hypothetical protein
MNKLDLSTLELINCHQCACKVEMTLNVDALQIACTGCSMITTLPKVGLDYDAFAKSWNKFKGQFVEPAPYIEPAYKHLIRFVCDNDKSIFILDPESDHSYEIGISKFSEDVLNDMSEILINNESAFLRVYDSLFAKDSEILGTVHVEVGLDPAETVVDFTKTEFLSRWEAAYDDYLKSKDYD